ncbi:hypothetical protein GCM10023189_38130 [Nibrella saemangeumensis]|uniref:Tetratricopeptide repeat protein n=1 Tax=Nibrella saemangeumensis TaxID=1084526 RepID=A0ABP8N659_9BACT
MSKKKQPSKPAKPAPNVYPTGAPAASRPGPVRAVPVRPQPVTTKTAATSTEPDLPIETRPVTWWPSAILAVVAFALYINTFGHGYVLDDIAAISQNLFVQEGLKGIPQLLKVEFWHFSNISLGYYRPLSLITFAIEQEYFKNDPSVSHMVNALLYGLTGLVLGVLLQKWLPGKVIMAFLIGLLFIAHPIHTEVVANIKSRDEIMSFLFIISMLLMYWRYLETDKPIWITAASATLYLAFLSKETSIVSLALLPAMQYYFAKRSVWRSLLSLWPFLLVAAVFFFQKKMMIGTLSGNPPMDWANYPYAMTKTQVPTTFKFLLYYIRLLVLPHPLVYDYSYNVIPPEKTGGMVLAGFLVFLGLVWLAWIGFRRRTLWGFGLYWFFVTMVPALGFIFSRGGILAERFLYAPALAFAIIFVWGLNKLFDRWQHTQTDSPRPVLVRYAPMLALVVVVSGLYSFKTVDRNNAWKDNFTLFNTDLKNAPNSCQVQRHVANEWIDKGVKSRAKADSTVMVLRTRTRQDSIQKAQAAYTVFDKDAGKYARLALNHLQESCRIYPSFGESYFSMAYVFQKITPNRDSAVYYYKQTIRAANNYAPAYNNLGVIYQGEGKYQLASYYYNQSMAVNPAYADGRNNWAALKQATGLDVKMLPDSVLTKN